MILDDSEYDWLILGDILITKSPQTSTRTVSLPPALPLTQDGRRIETDGAGSLASHAYT